jgi:hypothetical protein
MNWTIVFTERTAVALLYLVAAVWAAKHGAHRAALDLWDMLPLILI